MPSNSDHGMNARLCGLGVFLLVLGVAGYGGIQLAESRIEKTSHWPKVSGRIATSEMATAIVKTGPVRRASDFAKICYVYSVGGREYVCDRERVVPMLHFRPDGTPEETLRRYPVGRSVDVYYDPHDPSDALLTPVPGEDSLQLIRSLAFISPCVALVGLLIAGVAGMNRLGEQRGNTPAPATQVNVVRSERPTSSNLDIGRAAPAAAKPVEARTTHWLVRGASVFLGLCLLLFGGPMSVTVARMSDPKIGIAVKVIALMMVGGAALFGAFLVYIGMRKQRRASAVAAAH